MKVGIIGGGQLARLLIESSPDFNYIVLEPKVKNSCIDLDCEIINCNYNDLSSINKIYNECEFITYEFENIDENVLNDFKNKIYPPINFLKISKNRIKEKKFANNYNLKTVNYVFTKSIKEIKNIAENKIIPLPFLVKLNEGGYDGKGQFRINNIEDINNIPNSNVGYLIEEILNFDFETSVIVTRSKFNQVYFYPMPINVHQNGLLRKSTVVKKNNKLLRSVKRKIKKIMINENIIGTVAFEFFVKNKKLYFNEMAPRVHNTGHYTIDGCNVSQFRNHILAITSNKIIKPKLLYNTIMINLLGDEINLSYKNEKIKIYNYIKDKAEKNRKMGHINIVCKSKKNLFDICSNVTKHLEELND
ncbi:ATP-grasp domain-containing protein [Spiroplasma turonicum]|uniref:ATP-grasp domain-containing protein n=1 Tax=Spiroplasma turonicum TaxID=216946 RepID=A0A0K1P8K7_9MOLU|nr:ATP-grasp domain-containing protein [Spiroplasma turonicum]AKU80237.1 hypothetical protein STURON_00991 [Spiroplasma turonicum]ALX71237.1 5-(carboxyamino)imidazole ribonucleotide synthase [Spiroplasma turonicum]